ncbi:MAG: DUF456 domain-containing protein [Chthoniobacterales bacterium]
MAVLFWIIAVVLMAIGLIGTVVPVLPGTTIILGAAVIHRLALGASRSLGISALAGLLALTVISYALDAAAGYLGAKRFGATRWGVAGGVIGGIAGLFFGIPGLFLGPVLGAIAGELVSGKKLVKAGRAGWGTILGLLAGAVAKIVIGLAMVAIFLTNVPSPL